MYTPQLRSVALRFNTGVHYVALGITQFRSSSCPVITEGRGDSLLGALLHALNEYTQNPRVVLSFHFHISILKNKEYAEVVVRFCGTDDADGEWKNGLYVGVGREVVEAFTDAYFKSMNGL
ncbi:MAG: hypothetical protein WDZ75_01115 [Candidatus Paceibacterota bacterium]